jgi:hypothetical protein
MDPDCGFQNGSIQLQAKLRHGVRFIDFFRRQELQSQGAEGFFRSGDDASRLLPTARDVKQAEQYPVRTHSQEIIEIAADALGIVDCRNLSILQTRHSGLHRFSG